MAGKQAVSLRTHVIDLPQNAFRDFPLDTEVVLSRVLRAHMGLEVPIKEDGAEAGPILSCSRLRT